MWKDCVGDGSWIAFIMIVAYGLDKMAFPGLDSKVRKYMHMTLLTLNLS